jgi:hypothetical protein
MYRMGVFFLGVWGFGTCFFFLLLLLRTHKAGGWLFFP